jgi:hypothetical protein
MKFRPTLQALREPREDGKTPVADVLRFPPLLRSKKSKAVVDEKDDAKEAANGPEATPPPAKKASTMPPTKHEDRGLVKSSKKQAMQEFFRNTGANLKGGFSFRHNKLAGRAPRQRKSRVYKPPSKRNSHQMRSLDINDEVLDRLMGPPKDMTSTKIQSDDFFIKQRIRASSRAASAGYMSKSQAEHDRKPLSAEEVLQLFAGAPYFSVEDDRPKAMLKDGKEDERVKLSADYRPFEHSTFAASTLHPVDSDETSGARRIRVREVVEVPNMLTATGLDAGTISFEHFLQLPIADSNMGTDEPDFFENRKLLSEPEGLGLRETDVEALIDRLAELGDLRAILEEEADLFNEAKVSEMGEDLFRRLLDAELGTTPAGTGSVTLKTQVVALRKVLDEAGVWYDFSEETWRLRVGQLLWATEQDGITEEEERHPSDRVVLLLQIALAAELLVRLEALEALSEETPALLISEDDREAIFITPSRKIQWDLVLAQRFLDQMTVTADVPDPRRKAANRTSLFSSVSFKTAKESVNGVEPAIEPIFRPKNESEQLAGLVCFAERIGWPHTKDVQKDLEGKLAAASAAEDEEDKDDGLKPPRPVSGLSGLSVYATPLGSPALPPDYPPPPGLKEEETTDYINSQSQKRPKALRMASATSVHLLPATQSDSDGPAAPSPLEVGGWLSRSWLSGLVLPGEPASHLLISTLLENSPKVMDALGAAANLYGGFFYHGNSYWSKRCVLGRVLAATRTAKECMGWISIPGRVPGQQDGWINLEVRDVPSGSPRPRIEHGDAISRASDPLNGADPASIQAGDFVAPIDGPPVMGNECRYHDLAFKDRSISGKRLSSATDLTKQLMEAPRSPDRPSSCLAKLTFGSPINSKLAKLEIILIYDVHFIASHPCHPEPARTGSKAGSKTNSKAVSPIEGGSGNDEKLLEGKENKPMDSARESGGARSSGITMSLKDIEKELPPPPAHPLHIDYAYDIVPVATLLSVAPDTRPRSLSKSGNKSGNDDEVVVLDCRGTEDLELLARAWCSKVGENALIGQSGRTCLSCCIREARALGVCVVIRT